MEDQHAIKGEGPVSATYMERNNTRAFDPLQPLKIISRSNVYIIYLSIALFGFYAFARHGFNWIALSTSLIVSVPIGFAIAFFETQAGEFVFGWQKNTSAPLNNGFPFFAAT